MPIFISEGIEDKLWNKHQVNVDEVYECLSNRQRGDGNFITDTRAKNSTEPPTTWFLARTDEGRLLKVVFILNNQKSPAEVYIKTAYEPNLKEKRIWLNRHRSIPMYKRQPMRPIDNNQRGENADEPPKSRRRR